MESRDQPQNVIVTPDDGGWKARRELKSRAGKRGSLLDVVEWAVQKAREDKMEVIIKPSEP